MTKKKLRTVIGKTAKCNISEMWKGWWLNGTDAKKAQKQRILKTFLWMTDSWVEKYHRAFEQWAMIKVCRLCTDRLQPPQPRQQSLAWPDLAQSGLSLQATGPVSVGGAGGDTWATAVGTGAPVRGPLDAVGDGAKRRKGQAAAEVLTRLLHWKEVQEGGKYLLRAWSWKMFDVHSFDGSSWVRKFSTNSLTWCKLLLGRGESASKNSTHRCFTHMETIWHLSGIELFMWPQPFATQIYCGLLYVCNICNIEADSSIERD